MEVAVLFVDVRRSTALGELMPPAAFAALMNNFYQVATDILVRRNAIIDKLVGDEVMALFIAGVCGARYRAVAVEAGEEILLALGYDGGGRAWIPAGVGVHTGPAFVGKIGTEGIFDFTALGDTVNIAARLQAEAAEGEMVLSDAAYEAVAESYPGLERRLLTLRGRAQPLAVRVLRPGSA